MPASSLTSGALLDSSRSARTGPTSPDRQQASLFAAPTVREPSTPSDAYVVAPSADTSVGATSHIEEADTFWRRHVWPALASVLSGEASEDEVAQRLGVERTQARRWLQRALGEGRARRMQRPVRYVLTPHDSE